MILFEVHINQCSNLYLLEDLINQGNLTFGRRHNDVFVNGMYATRHKKLLKNNYLGRLAFYTYLFVRIERRHGKA